MKARKIGALFLALALCGAAGCETQDPEKAATQKQKEEAASAAQEIVSSLESNQMKKIGDPITVQKTVYTEDGATDTHKLEITVQGVKVYENYTETGIAEEEFQPIRKAYLENPLVMVDVKIKKIGGSKPDRSDWEQADNITMLRLYNRTLLEAIADAGCPEVSYFSGHPDLEAMEQSKEDYSVYSLFYLDPGEEAEFQVGWFFNGPNEGKEQSVVLMEDAEGLVLFVDDGTGINPSSTRNCVDLSTDAS